MNKKNILLITDEEIVKKIALKLFSETFFIVTTDEKIFHQKDLYHNNFYAILIYMSKNKADFANYVQRRFEEDVEISCPTINLKKINNYEELVFLSCYKKFEFLLYMLYKRKKWFPLDKISESQKEFMYKLDRACKTDCTVLLQGNSGSGKNYTAQLIHKFSSRRREVFMDLNIMDINSNLVESKLFGCEKGAYTDAVQTKGVLEEVEYGTLNVDEIGDADFNIQSKFYHLLDTNEFNRLGSNQKRHFNGRLIFSTNADLEKLVKEGKFKEPLFYRINVLVIKVPDLKDHKQDIKNLARKFSVENQKIVTPEAILKLEKYDWPGNIRQLKNVVYRACALCPEYRISPEYIFFD